MTELLQLAQDTAARFHGNQVDKAGQPYILHLLRVSAAGSTEAEQVVGALHDIFEDTNVSAHVILSRFGAEVTEAISAMTRAPGEGYKAYIERVSRNPLASRVKINDLHDNFNRLDSLPDQALATRLTLRYGEALMQLGAL